MRLVPSSDGPVIRLGGLGPSVGAAVSLLAAGVLLSVLAASLFGVRVWPGPSDRGQVPSLRLPAAATPAPARRVAVSAPEAEATVTSRPRRTDSRRTVAPRSRRSVGGGRELEAPSARVAPRIGSRPVTEPTAVAPRTSKTVDPATGSAPGPAATTAPGPAATAAPAPPTTPVVTPAPTAAAPSATPGAVERTVSAARQVVAPVTTVLPPPVATPVDAVLNTVQETAKTVDQTLGGLGLQHKP